MTDEIKIIGEARYLDAESGADFAKIGVLNGQFFILLFPVAERVRSFIKKGVESLDPMETYIVKEHLRELAEPPVGEPLVREVCAAEREEPEGWDYRYGYLDKTDPPQRYVVLEPPVDSIAEPYEYVTKLLTATREKGAKLNLEFVSYEGEPPPLEEDDDGED